MKTRPSPHLDVSIMLMRRGWTSALQSAQHGGVLSLSQRVGQLKDEWLILDRWRLSPTGARFKEYRIVGRRSFVVPYEKTP